VSRAGRMTKIGALTVGALVVAVLIAAVLVVATPPGTRLAVSMGERAAGGMVSIGKVSGTLVDDLTLTDITFENDSTRVVVERASLDWHARRLFARELFVDALVLKGLDVTVTPPTDEPPPEPEGEPFALPELPVAIVVRKAAIEQADITYGERTFLLDALSAGLAWDAERIALTSFSLKSGPHEVGAKASAEVEAEGGDVAAELDYAGAIKGRTAEVDFGAGGTTELVELSLTLSAIAEARLDAAVDLSGDVPLVEFELTHETLPADLTGLPAELSGGGLTGRASSENVTAHYAVDVAPDPDTPPFTLTLDVDADLSEAASGPVLADVDWQLTRPDPALDVSGAADVRYGGSRLTVAHRTAAPYPSTLDLAVDLADTPVIEADLALEPFAPIALGDNAIRFGGGRVTANGPVSDLSVHADLAADAAPVGPVELALGARVGATDANVERLDLSLVGGRVEARARVGWDGTVAGTFDVDARDLNLSKVSQALDARVGTRLNGRFSLPEGGPEATVEITAIDGDWRGNGLSGGGSVAVSPKRIDVRDLEVAVGRNTMSASAVLGETLDGRAELALVELAAFDERLEGRIEGTAALTGRRDTPAVKLDLTGRRLAFDEATLATLDAAIDLDTARGASRSDITLTARDIDVGGQRFEALEVSAGGTRDAHEASLALTAGEGAPLGATLSLTGGLDEAMRWRGRLLALELVETPAGSWVLDDAVTVTVDEARRVTTEEACLKSADASLCATLTGFTAGAGRIDAALDGLPLDLAANYLPSDLTVEGTVGGSARIAHTEPTEGDGAPAVMLGTVALSVADGAASIETGEGTTRVPMERAHADIELAPERFEGEIDAVLPGWLTVKAGGELARGGSGGVDVAFDLDVADIEWITRFAPTLAGSTGRVVAVGAVTGTLSAPEVTTRVRTEEANVRVPMAGIDLDDLVLEIVTDPERRVTIDGRIASAAGGELTLDGTIDAGRIPVDDESVWPIRFAISGEDFALTRLPEADLDISPELTVRARTGGRVDVEGRVVVPRLRFELVQVPASTVSVSDDQVIVHPDGTPVSDDEKGPPALQGVSAKVDVVLGDDVSVSGLGLSTSLEGSLTLKREKDDVAPALATGQVAMVGGYFDAYGQDLSIEKGAFLFGGPIDNPALDVRAVRAGIPVTAGVLVTGTARAPRIDLFSNPAMDDPNKLSWILTGSPLSGASNSDASLIAQAATSFGLEQAAVITNELKGLFQLDELGVDSSDGALENTSLVAGKQLTPKLSLRTQLDLFDQLWSFFLRYDLTQRWAVEAESGRRQGADLIYSIDRERFFDFSWPWWSDD